MTETAIAGLAVAPGSSFLVTSDPLGRDFAAITTGISTPVAAGVKLSIDYTGEIGQNDRTVHQVSLRTRIAF